jgi:TRAP transporter TAXI family solute receptor
MLHQFNLLFVLLLILAAGIGVGWLIYDERRTETLTVAAGARASEGFRLVEAVASVVNTHHPRLDLEVIETGGSLDNNRLMDEGYADLALFQADAITSTRARLVANLYPDVYQLIVRRAAGIESVADLAGKTIALPSKGSAQFTSFWHLASHYGLSEGDLTWLPMSNRSAEWALISDAVDAAFRVRAPGDAAIRQLVELADITLVPIEQAPALHLRKSSIHPGRIPKGSYRGHPPLPEQDLATASVNRLLVAAEHVPDNTIYEITTVLFERRRELSELSSLASLISVPDTGSGITLPLHEGAALYFDRDQPSFWSEQADLLRTMLSLLAIFASMFFGFRNWFQGRQKDRADAYNKDLLALYESARNGEHDARHYRDALADILVRVVDDLDNDRISRDGFDEFSFTWQAVSRLLDEEHRARPSLEAGA